MKKDPNVFLKHILECIDLIEKYSKNLSKKDFESNTELQDAVIRRLEIIGEAARNLPDEFKSNYSDRHIIMESFLKIEQLQHQKLMHCQRQLLPI